MVCAAHVPFLLSEHSAVVISVLGRWESDFLERGSIRGNEVLGGEIVFAGLVFQKRRTRQKLVWKGDIWNDT